MSTDFFLRGVYNIHMKDNFQFFPIEYFQLLAILAITWIVVPIHVKNVHMISISQPNGKIPVSLVLLIESHRKWGQQI